MQLERQIDDELKKNYTIYEDIAHNFSYLGFNLKSEKFKNPKVREALSLAIDRQELVDILYFGHGKVCNGPFLPGTGAFNETVKSPNPTLKEPKNCSKKRGMMKIILWSLSSVRVRVEAEVTRLRFYNIS